MNFLGIFNRDEEESERARGDQDAEGSIPGLWLQGRGQHKQVGKWCSLALVREAAKKTFFLGYLSQMWVGGVADSQTRSKPLKTPPNHSENCLFDPNFTFCFPKSISYLHIIVIYIYMYSNATSAGGEAQMIWTLRGGSRAAVLSLSFLFVNYDGYTS